jgi:hypothetical protein
MFSAVGKKINQCGFIYSILSDYMSGHDATAKNKVGQNLMKLFIITDNYKFNLKLASLLVARLKVLTIHF